MEQLEIVHTTSATNDITILSLKGPLTLQTLFEFQNAIRQPGIGNTIIDLTDVPYIDSAGLGTILSHWAHTQRLGEKFAVAGASERVCVLFKLTKVDTVMPCFSSVQAAEQSMSGISTAASSA